VPAEYLREPREESYGSHGTVGLNFLRFMNLRGKVSAVVNGHCGRGKKQSAFSHQHSAGQGHTAIKDFPHLLVWEKAHRLTLAAYKATSKFPGHELYGLTSQMRRCAASIAANIAEGCGKRGNGEFQRFLNIATGSASELEYHFLLAKDLGLLKEVEYVALNDSIIEVKRMLASLVRKVEQERLAG
jgi:four helix bundle protein